MSHGSAANSNQRDASHFALRVPAATAYLSVVRQLVAVAAREHCFPLRDAARAVMAVDEACVNVIEHAYQAEEPAATRLLDIEVEADRARLLVVIADRARAAFSPLEHPTPDIETYWAAGRTKGLGILILRSFMDDVSHTYHPDRGNELRLIKYAARPQAPRPD
jgi:anti-sigma regulatory factor (Ser/Thr protein kinase)